ncbi:MAG: thioredoxin domain-containing protein [Bacteroidales bacterium]|nr:thioredoxin domain-containing protein [Bacteroidales bacterium]
MLKAAIVFFSINISVLFAQIPQIDEKNFFTSIQDKLVLVDFYATWCFPCKIQEKVLIEVKDSLKHKLHIFRVDVDKSPSLSESYAIEYLPTLILFKNGIAIKKWVGLHNKSQLLQNLNPYLM